MEGLPRLPGYSFYDPTRTGFQLSQQFDFLNGYAYPRIRPCGVGKAPLDVESTAYIKEPDFSRYDPTMTYGCMKRPTVPPVIPHYVHYAGKCLTFRAFFRQGIAESPLEYQRVRSVNLIYFLEDDTLMVIEPKYHDAGFLQGKLVKRGKIPKNDLGECWHWKDLNIGIDIPIYGVAYHTVDCDRFTREFMDSQGIELAAVEEMPPDPYIMERRLMAQPKTTITPSLDSKMRRFLEFDGKILRFYGVWDNREAEYGELMKVVVYYFLADDCVRVAQVHSKNDGYDPFPLILNRMKLPKDWKDVPLDFPSGLLEKTDDEVTSFYTPIDFIVGRTIFALGRRIMLYDADKFTREYYEKILKITQPPAIQVFPEPLPPQPREIPPHNGIGVPEDSYQNCLSFVLKPPRKDVVRMIMNANHNLRYSAILDWVHPEDSIRKFIIIYSLSFCTLKVVEPPIKNSGFKGGTFLASIKVPKPGTDPSFPEYYTPEDLYIGARVNVFEHQFVITGADLHVYRYMQDNPGRFRPEVVANVRNWLAGQNLLREDVRCLYEREEEDRKIAEDEAKAISGEGGGDGGDDDDGGDDEREQQGQAATAVGDGAHAASEEQAQAGLGPSSPHERQEQEQQGDAGGGGALRVCSPCQGRPST